MTERGEAVRAVQDPTTGQGELAAIAGEYPDLRPHVAVHPSAYPDLLTWLGQLGDPAVDSALAWRAQQAVPQQPAPPQPGPAAWAAPGTAPARPKRRTGWLVGGGVAVVAVGVTAALIVANLLGASAPDNALRAYPSQPTEGWSIDPDQVWDAAGGPWVEDVLWTSFSGWGDDGLAVVYGDIASGQSASYAAGVDLRSGELTWTKELRGVGSCSSFGSGLMRCSDSSGSGRETVFDIATGEELARVPDVVTAARGDVLSAYYRQGGSTMTVTLQRGADEVWSEEVELSAGQRRLGDTGPSFYGRVEEDVVTIEFYGYLDDGSSRGATSVLSRGDGSLLGSFDGEIIGRAQESWVVRDYRQDQTVLSLVALDGSAETALGPETSSVSASSGSDLVLYATDGGELVAVSESDPRTTVWTERGDSRNEYAPYVEYRDGSVVVLADYDYDTDVSRLQVHRMSDGSELWTSSGSVVASDDQRLVVIDDRRLSAYLTTDGSQVWSMTSGEDVRQVAGRLFVSDGYRYTVLEP